MKNVWQRFVELVGPDPESAGVALLVAAFAVIVPVGATVHCLLAPQYAVAIGIIVASGGVARICVRDYRRGRWSLVSGVIVGIWVVLSGAVLLYGGVASLWSGLTRQTAGKPRESRRSVRYRTRWARAG